MRVPIRYSKKRMKACDRCGKKFKTQKEAAACPCPAKTEGLIEGEDYYMEFGLMIFTAKYLKERDYCCGNGCRNCPW
jgi:hypothetical protein